MNTDDGGMWMNWKRENVTFTEVSKTESVHRVFSSEQRSRGKLRSPNKIRAAVTHSLLVCSSSTRIFWKSGSSASFCYVTVTFLPLFLHHYRLPHRFLSSHTVFALSCLTTTKKKTINKKSFSVLLHYSFLMNALSRLNAQICLLPDWFCEAEEAFSLFWGVFFFFFFNIICDRLQCQRLHHSFHTRVCEILEVQEILINPQRTNSATLFTGNSMIAWTPAPAGLL